MKKLGLFCATLIAVSAASATSFSAEHKVMQAGKKFSPAVLNIKAGDKVTFINDDKYGHNVYSRTKGHKFRIKKQKPGQSNTLTFDKDGLIAVRCALHPRMKMTIKVTQ